MAEDKPTRHHHNFKDLTGQRFGKLAVIAISPDRSKGRTRWDCICDCGTHRTVLASALVSGVTKGCGCSRMEAVMAANVVHGLWNTKEYMAWSAAKDRCFNPRSKYFPGYGGRGITMCNEWKNDFMAFLRDMGHCPPNLQIDRIDNDGPYAPKNCRWTSRKEQARNRRSNLRITRGGETLTVVEWSEKTGLSHGVILTRYHRGRTADLLDPEVDANRITYEGETLTVHEWSQRKGILPGTIHSRIKRGVRPPELFDPVKAQYRNHRYRSE